MNKQVLFSVTAADCDWEYMRKAFVKMSETKQFKAWHKLETARRMGQLTDLKETVDNAMKSANIRIEGKVDGRWVPIEQAPFEETE